MTTQTGRSELTDRMLMRNARLVLRLQQVSRLYHLRCDHAGDLYRCLNPVCLKTLAVIEQNEQP